LSKLGVESRAQAATVGGRPARFPHGLIADDKHVGITEALSDY
jgi:hypothetical protein